MSYRFLLSRRWLILTLVAVALIPTMIRLGFWQLHRHEHRVANNHLIADSLAAEPVPVQRLTRPGADLPKKLTWHRVTATGHYDSAHQIVVRQRTASDGGRIGYYLITPLVTADGDAVLVNRGWIEPGDDITRFPPVPRTATGEVFVAGRLRPDETTASSGVKDKSGMPDRQVMLISSVKAAKLVPHRLLSGYIELTGTTPRPPAGQPELVPAPDHSGIGPHFAYAVQWWLFASMVPVGWVVLARRERKDLLEAAARQQAGAGPRPGGSDDEPVPAPAASSAGATAGASSPGSASE
ncbi:SURF1 family cytochrome oxidase biogenesis protein [Wenjunlia tyrosinilytica]|uniref:SURF1-like protein n=1 Tax=Wenjunlia tyrosinilytica TaxID=1544741 RepID=A0A917ZFU8_9ACTN|nr:SURF1 family protein [Wenjunlia tyrosinilytica]GGO81219.1 SURF1-like protein [Wenjunlia tyrosinilytica]